MAIQQPYEIHYQNNNILVCRDVKHRSQSRQAFILSGSQVDSVMFATRDGYGYGFNGIKRKE